MSSERTPMRLRRVSNAISTPLGLGLLVVHSPVRERRQGLLRREGVRRRLRRREAIVGEPGIGGLGEGGLVVLLLVLSLLLGLLLGLGLGVGRVRCGRH